MNQGSTEDEPTEFMTTDEVLTAEPGPESAAEVAFVMPASIFESVVTDLIDLPSSGVTGLPRSALDSSEAMAELGEKIDQRFDELKALFQRETRAEAAREKVIDRLHAELQEYKQDLLLSTLKPVFIDLIQLHDDIGKVAAPPAGNAETEPGADRLADLLQGFQQGIEDILYRQGVEPFHVDGDAFDPRRQRAVATVATDDPALNKAVAVRLRKGFRAGDRVIRPEIVSVHALRK